MSDFEAERAALIGSLAESRGGLVDVIARLQPEDFERARRGSWSVARVLEHVLHSERLYTQLISVFSGKATEVPEATVPGSAAEASSALDRSRNAFLSAISDVKEDDFYRLQTVGHDEYSVLSIIENNTAHDHEHAEQIKKTVSQ